MATALIRPGIMVSLKSSVSGGVQYVRSDLDAQGDGSEITQPLTENGKVERWETTKVVADAAEHEQATKIRNAAVNAIRKCCAVTAFGYLCPEETEEDLDRAIVEARTSANEFNAFSKHTKVAIYVLKGRIASTDEEAARAIGEEVRTLIESMDKAIDRLDPAAIRDAATKAAQMRAMLEPAAAEKVSDAIEQARKAARMITKRVEKEGEAAEVVLRDIQRGALLKARMTMLDMDDAPAESTEEKMPAVNVQRFNELDLASGDDEV